MNNILLQPPAVRPILMVNILTTVFSEIPTDLAERLSPLTTRKSMHHISKNFASALLGANFLSNNLESLNYEMNSTTILSFVAQNDLAKVNAHCCSIITAIFGIQAGNPIPLLYSVCIKTIEVTKHLEFLKWHAEVHKQVPQLQYIFLNVLHKVLSQLANFSTNSVNNSLIEHGNNGRNLKVDPVLKIVKFVT